MGKSKCYAILPLSSLLKNYFNANGVNIYINNTEQQITDNARVAEVLQLLSVSASKGIAIAVNNNVIPRSEWDTYTLKEEDKITLIKAAQGG